jgi:hypothetical protein
LGAAHPALIELMETNTVYECSRSREIPANRYSNLPGWEYSWQEHNWRKFPTGKLCIEKSAVVGETALASGLPGISMLLN